MLYRAILYLRATCNSHRMALSHGRKIHNDIEKSAMVRTFFICMIPRNKEKGGS